MAVPPDVIDSIRDRVDLLAVIGDYVPLKKAGRNWVGLCPFHADKKSPSFSVSPEKGLFYCFGCGAGGDVFAFLKKIENINFMEAIERLAKRVGVEIPRKQLTPEEQSRREDKDRIASLLEEAASHYHKLLTKDPAGEECREYLKKRGFDIEIAREFRLGWAPREWDTLLSHLTSRKYTPRDIEKAGIIVQKDSGGYYDKFRGRIMFPIISVQGRVLGFGGRLVADEAGPKYMNSPESPLYQKSRVLYGLNAAHKAIHDRDSAIIVEGYFDLLALVKNGFENIVAPCGTALTVEQVTLLTRYTKNLYPLFDADEAGEKARMRSLEVILRAGAHPKSATMPKGMDPDEFLAKEGKEAMQKILEDSKSLLDVAAGRIIGENGTSVEGRQKSMIEIAGLLAQMSDMQAREMYVRDFASRIGGAGSGAEDLLRKEVARMTGAGTTGQSPQRRQNGATPESRKDMPEYYLLALLLSHSELVKPFARDKELMGDIENPDLARLAQRVIEEGHPSPNPSKYLDSLEGEGTALLSKLIIEEPEEYQHGKLEQVWAKTVLRVKLSRIRRLKDEIQARLSGAKPEELPELHGLKEDLMNREKQLKGLIKTDELTESE